MVRRKRPRGSRKKTIKPKKKDGKDYKKILKSFLWSLFVWVLFGANVIFFISIIFQIMSGSATPIKPTKTTRTVVENPATPRIKVEVLNGCGVDKIAARLRDYLVNKQFDVVDFKNYERFDIPQTLIIDRKYLDKRYAQKLANVIGVKKDQILPQISPQRKLDVSIIIGKDYLDLKAFKKIYGK